MSDSDVTHVHVGPLCFQHNKSKLHLVNMSPYTPKYTPLWTELEEYAGKGIKVSLYIEGENGESFDEILFPNFGTYYRLLHNLLSNKKCITGVNLTVGNGLAIECIEKITYRLRSDFGRELSISLATNEDFIYDKSYLKIIDEIDYIIVPLATGTEDISERVYEGVIAAGCPTKKVIMGISQVCVDVDVDKCKDIIRAMSYKYGDTFGGVSFREYSGAPEEWAKTVKELTTSTSSYATCAVA